MMVVAVVPVFRIIVDPNSTPTLQFGVGCTNTSSSEEARLVFLLQLLKIRPLFDWSVSWSIAQDSSISYWFDSRTYPTKASHGTPEISTRKYSLQMALSWGICQDELVDKEKIKFVGYGQMTTNTQVILSIN